jgi:precorrin-2 dehydrogenase/sirohydrochlorin ferrochelatase
MSLYPVNMDVHGVLCLIIGGGSVASRKVDSLLSCGAEIRVISPGVCARIAGLAKDGLLEWQQREYNKGDLAGAQLVFAATDSPEIQKQVVAEATAAAILVNVIDMPEACTFQVPASFRQGELLLTVATGGGSPALAARIRRDLEASYGPEYGLLVAMMADLRKEIVGSSDSHADHKRIFEKLLDSDILECFRQQQWDELSTLLQKILPGEIDVLRLVKEMQNYNKEQMV